MFKGIFRAVNGHNKTLAEISQLTANMQEYLGTALHQIESHTDPLDRFVAYFQQVQALRPEYGGPKELQDILNKAKTINTTVTDRKTGEKEYDKIIDALSKIKYLADISESEYRKEKGVAYTPENLLIGGVFQRFHVSVARWKETIPAFDPSKDVIKKSRELSVESSDTDIIRWRAEGIVAPAVDDLKSALEEIKRFNAQHLSPAALKTLNVSAAPSAQR